MSKNIAYAERRRAEIARKKARNTKTMKLLSVVVVAIGLLIGCFFLGRALLAAAGNDFTMERSESRAPYAGYWWQGEEYVAVFRENGIYSSLSRQSDGSFSEANRSYYAVGEGKLYISSYDTGKEFSGIWEVSMPDENTMILNGVTLTKGEAPTAE